MYSLNELNNNIKYGYNNSSYGSIGEETQKYLYKSNSNNFIVVYYYKRYGYDDRETINIILEFEIIDNNEKTLKLINMSMNYDNIYGGGFPKFIYEYNPSVNFIFKYTIINNIFDINFQNIITNNKSYTSYNQTTFDTISKINLSLKYVKNINLDKIF